MVEDLRKYTRRDFLKIGAAIGGGVFLTPRFFDRLIIPVAEQYTAWIKADAPNDQFLEENKHKLARLKLGGSFSPEQVHYLNGETDEKSSPTEAQKIIVEDLDITDLRLGIRWSHAMFQNHKVNLAYYRPYIDYCLSKDVNLCLNVGPIKTFRWPEQHIPYFLKDNLPRKGAVITPDMEIAKTAMEYLDLLLHQLTSEYGADLRKNTSIVQLENEPLVPYGEFEWTMSADYFQKVNSIAKPYFPNSKFLINTGPFIVEPVSGLLNQLSKDGIKPLYGVDYYYKIDDHTNSNNWIMQLPLLGSLDLLTISKIFGRSIQPKNMHLSDIEVTEGQFEGWGKHPTPGIRGFRYLLLRCMDNIFDANANNMLIRLWGLEAFAQKIMRGEDTENHKQIVQLMHAINRSTN